MKVGDLVRTLSGRFGTIVRAPYTHRFMEQEDWDMADAGIGHFAGLYGTAIDVIFTDSGSTHRLRSKQFEVIVEK